MGGIKLSVRTIEKIADFYREINEVLGLSCEYKFRIEKNNKYPISARDGDIILVPEFFNHPEITDDQRKMMAILTYSIALLSKNNEVLPINPQIPAKAICESMDIKFISIKDLETALRKVRVKLYDDVRCASIFSIGDELRIDIATRFRVVDIYREDAEIFVVVQNIGSCKGRTDEVKTFEESALYELAYRQIL